jgi:mono/diheme cytochrome c family protein
MNTRIALLSVSLAAFLAGAGLAADATAGKAVYDKSCKSCHGADGAPNAAVAKMMKVEMKDLKAPDVQSRSDADLKKVVTAGEGKMKAMPAVSGASLDDCIAYMRSLKK